MPQGTLKRKMGKGSKWQDNKEMESGKEITI